MTHEWAAVIREAGDLITTADAIVSGFTVQASMKAERAAPYLDQARRFGLALGTVTSVEDVLSLGEYLPEIAAAAHISQKARRQIPQQQLTEAIGRVLANVYDDCASQAESPEEQLQLFRQSLVSRYLLTAGATFDGVMRNAIGAAASEQLTRAIEHASGQAASLEKVDQGDLDDLQLGLETAEADEPTSVPPVPMTLRWDKRVLVFNVRPTVPDIGRLKNIDLVLAADEDQVGRLALHADGLVLLACGELKGGIDPAGADEHWKTAMSALDRIADAYDKAGITRPALFFVGAVIVAAMAEELYERLESGSLDFAANLTKPDQVQALAEWLVSL